MTRFWFGVSRNSLAGKLTLDSVENITVDAVSPVVIAGMLVENEDAIVAELNEVQGDSVDIGGYYYLDREKTTAVMRPSKTFNEALESEHSGANEPPTE